MRSHGTFITQTNEEDTMSRYLEVQVGDKGTILIDVTPEEGLFAAGGEDIVERAEDAFEKAMGTIRTCAEGFFEHVKNFPEYVCPQEVTMEFGITFGTEVGAVVTKTSGEANFKVSLTWKESAPST
jgi:hypothetical protein